MKNFTNNFKQITSRLSARWLIMALMLLVGTSSVWADHIQNTGSMCLKYWPGSGSDIWTSAIDLGKTLNLGDISGTPYIKAAWVKTQGGTSINYLKIVIYIDGVYKGDYGVNYSGNSSYWDRTFEGSFDIAFNTTPGEHTIEIKAEPNNATHGSTYVKYNVPGVVDPCIPKFYLAGTFPGLSWTAGESGGQEMVCNDGVHTKTYKNVTLEAKKYEYKVTGVNGWGDNEFPGSGNSEYTVESAGNYDVTFTYVPNTSLSVSLKSACSAPSNVSISRVPSTKPCPGTEVTLEANVGEGDVESYSWSVAGTGWSINGNGNTDQTCTFIAGTETGNISLTVSGCSSSDDATTSIEVKSTATETDFTVSNNEYTYDGTAKAATVKWSDNQSTEGINITYDPASPIDAGSYDIKVTTSEHGDLCASNAAITLTEKLTITQATQTGFEINNTTLNICGTSVVVTSTGGQGGDVTYTIATDNTTTKDATINSTTGELKVNSAGTVIITATKAATTNYKVATNSEEFTFIMLPNVALKETSISVCSNEEINLSEYLKEQSGTIKWYSDSEYNTEITELIFTPNPQTYYVKATNGECAPATAALDVSVTQVPSKPTFDAIPAQCGSYTLPTEDKNKVNVNWYTAATGGEKITSVTTTDTYFAEAVDGTCISASRTPVQITINTTPTITASKTSCAPYEEITLSSAAGAGTTWSTDGGMLSATSGESVTFKAAPAGTPYTVAASANGCTDTKTITVECAAEDCSSKSVEFEIWLKVTGTIPTCHVWMDGTSDLGITSWPGNAYSTTKTEGGQIYYIWKFNRPVGNSYKDIGVIFSYDNGKNGKTGDIIVEDALGKRHVFAYNSSDASKTTKPENSEALYSPTVTTVSAEQKEGEAAVVIKGFLQATGCADITKYGYQYRVSGNGDYTDVQVTDSKNICEEWIVECDDLEFGETYDFRAKATNEGGGKGYGDVIQVTIQGQSTPVVIKAVRNDRTVNESHWADFVALYVQEDGISTAGAGATKATKYTWEYSTDGTDWVTNFTGYVLGGASATVGVTNGSEKCNNIRPTKTGKYRVKVTYDNDAVQESNIITITSDGFKLKYPEYGQNAGSDFAFEAANRTIPVFVVKTTENFPDCPASGMPSQDVEGQKAKKSVDVKIFDNGNVVYDRKARMNYRGSSSLNFRKKSYAFCTGKEKTKNSKGDVDTGKENLFGLSNGAKDKDWVLYAAMPDPSMMRNRLIFDTYAQMTGKWGVNSMFVELIIDDEYMGVYVLMDKITNNENRVNITAADGFILKFDKTDVTDRFEDENSEKRNTFTTKNTGKSGIGSYGATFDQRFEIEYPEMEDMGTEKWVEFVNDNVKGKIEAFEKALEAGNYTEVRKLIDYESWADWFIISEFAKNVDAYRASCFFVYNGDKIEARPLWDQELSFDNTATTVGNGKGCNSPDGLLIQNSGVYSDDFPAPFWFIGHTDENKSSTITGGLLNDPCFVTMVKNRYKDHLNNALSNGQLTGKISDYQEELTDAAKTRETNTWRPTSGEITACTGGGTGYTNILVSTSISTMTDWITKRPAKLTTALDALTGSSVNISIEPSFVETYPWEPFTLTVDAPEGYEYEMAFTKEGADATGNMVVVKGGDIYTIKIKRPANTVEQVFETVPYLATATLKVADDGCGGMTTPEANVNIRLNDREEDCE